MIWHVLGPSRETSRQTSPGCWIWSEPGLLLQTLPRLPPLRAPGLDACDHVRLLHPDVELVDRPSHGADAGYADGEGVDTSSHTVILGRTTAGGLGILGSPARPFDRPRTAKPAHAAIATHGVMQNQSSGIEGKVVAITGASSGIGDALLSQRAMHARTAVASASRCGSVKRAVTRRALVETAPRENVSASAERPPGNARRGRRSRGGSFSPKPSSRGTCFLERHSR